VAKTSLTLSLLGFGAVDITKPYKCTGFGAIDITKPYKCTGFGAIDITKPYKFIGFGAIYITNPHIFIAFGAPIPMTPEAAPQALTPRTCPVFDPDWSGTGTKTYRGVPHIRFRFRGEGSLWILGFKVPSRPNPLSGAVKSALPGPREGSSILNAHLVVMSAAVPT
jgi:hypothetical protein